MSLDVVETVAEEVIEAYDAEMGPEVHAIHSVNGIDLHFCCDLLPPYRIKKPRVWVDCPACSDLLERRVCSCGRPFEVDL